MLTIDHEWTKLEIVHLNNKIYIVLYLINAKLNMV